jgi:hypothetical protein
VLLISRFMSVELCRDPLHNFTAGAGLLHQYGDSNMPVGTKFAFNYGGGLKLPRLAGPLGLRLDLRGYRTTGIFSSSLNMFEASGGILLSMGK